MILQKWNCRKIYIWDNYASRKS